MIEGYPYFRKLPYSDVGILKWGGYPIGWMVCFMDNLIEMDDS